MPTASLEVDQLLLVDVSGYWRELDIRVRRRPASLEAIAKVLEERPLEHGEAPVDVIVLELKAEPAKSFWLSPAERTQLHELAMVRLLEDATSDRVSVASAAAKAAARWFGRRSEPSPARMPTCPDCRRWNYHLVSCPRRFR